MVKQIPNLKLHKNYTDMFWSEFGVPGIGRRGVSTKSKDETIKALQKLGTVILYWSTMAQSYEYRRKRYDTYKSKLKGYQNFTHCFACAGRAEVRHHIIWIKHGGRNHKANIVALCKPCHALIHDWL